MKLSQLRQLIKEEIHSVLNEDDTHINKIARDLYSFLKQNGVNVVLRKSMPDKSKVIGDLSKQYGMSNPNVSPENQAYIFVYPGNKGSLEIYVQLAGAQGPVEEVEKKLLTAYPGLEQYDRNAGPLGMTSQQKQQSKVYGLTFRVREKTTKKGGFVSNTQTNKPI